MTIRLEVEDNFRQLNNDTAPLTIYKTNPVAAASANPNPAACNVQVTFDGSECFHPHPDIRIQSWEWDPDGNGVYGEDSDAQGMVTTARFGEFTFDIKAREFAGDRYTRKPERCECRCPGQYW